MRAGRAGVVSAMSRKKREDLYKERSDIEMSNICKYVGYLYF